MMFQIFTETGFVKYIDDAISALAVSYNPYQYIRYILKRDDWASIVFFYGDTNVELSMNCYVGYNNNQFHGNPRQITTPIHPFIHIEEITELKLISISGIQYGIVNGTKELFEAELTMFCKHNSIKEFIDVEQHDLALKFLELQYPNIRWYLGIIPNTINGDYKGKYIGCNINIDILQFDYNIKLNLRNI